MQDETERARRLKRAIIRKAKAIQKQRAEDKADEKAKAGTVHEA